MMGTTLMTCTLVLSLVTLSHCHLTRSTKGFDERKLEQTRYQQRSGMLPTWYARDARTTYPRQTARAESGTWGARDPRVARTRHLPSSNSQPTRQPYLHTILRLERRLYSYLYSPESSYRMSWSTRDRLRRLYETVRRYRIQRLNTLRSQEIHNESQRDRYYYARRPKVIPTLTPVPSLMDPLCNSTPSSPTTIATTPSLTRDSDGQRNHLIDRTRQSSRFQTVGLQGNANQEMVMNGQATVRKQRTGPTQFDNRGVDSVLLETLSTSTPTFDTTAVLRESVAVRDPLIDNKMQQSRFQTIGHQRNENRALDGHHAETDVVKQLDTKTKDGNKPMTSILSNTMRTSTPPTETSSTISSVGTDSTQFVFNEHPQLMDTLQGRTLPRTVLTASTPSLDHRRNGHLLALQSNLGSVSVLNQDLVNPSSVLGTGSNPTISPLNIFNRESSQPTTDLPLLNHGNTLTTTELPLLNHGSKPITTSTPPNIQSLSVRVTLDKTQPPAKEVSPATVIPTVFGTNVIRRKVIVQLGGTDNGNIGSNLEPVVSAQLNHEMIGQNLPTSTQSPVIRPNQQDLEQSSMASSTVSPTTTEKVQRRRLIVQFDSRFDKGTLQSKLAAIRNRQKNMGLSPRIPNDTTPETVHTTQATQINQPTTQIPDQATKKADHKIDHLDSSTHNTGHLTNTQRSLDLTTPALDHTTSTLDLTTPAMGHTDSVLNEPAARVAIGQIQEFSTSTVPPEVTTIRERPMIPFGSDFDNENVRSNLDEPAPKLDLANWPFLREKMKELSERING